MFFSDYLYYACLNLEEDIFSNERCIVSGPGATVYKNSINFFKSLNTTTLRNLTELNPLLVKGTGSSLKRVSGCSLPS